MVSKSKAKKSSKTISKSKTKSKKNSKNIKSKKEARKVVLQSCPCRAIRSTTA